MKIMDFLSTMITTIKMMMKNDIIYNTKNKTIDSKKITIIFTIQIVIVGINMLHLQSHY